MRSFARPPRASRQASSSSHGSVPQGRGADSASVDSALSSAPGPADVVGEGISSPSEPIATEVRNFMEARLGHDFGRVRIHAGGKAAASARSLGARAYTLGHHVVFGEGGYRPNTVAGRRLLSHELAHVIQQSGGGLGRGAGRSLLRAPVSGVVQRQVEPENEEEEVTGAELFERASSTRLEEVAEATHELETELDIPREGWEARIRHSGRTWTRTIGAMRGGRLNVYSLLRSITSRRAAGIVAEFERLETTPYPVDRALVLAIASREAGPNALPGEGAVSSLRGGGLDNLFQQQATRRQCDLLHRQLDALIAMAEGLLADRAELERQMQAQGMSGSVASMVAELERALPAYRRYRRSPCGELRWRQMLPRDFPELAIDRPDPGAIFTPNERGRPQLPALLPRSRALEAYGAVVALARERFLDHAARVSGYSRTELEELPLRAMRFWTMVFFGGTGWGQQLLNWWLSNGGDVSQIPHAPSPGRLGRNLPQGMPSVGPIAIARGRVTVMEAELIDRFLFQPRDQGATSTTPSTTAVPETPATSTEPSPAESAPATPGSQAETASELTLSMPSAPTTAPAGQRFTEYLVQIPDPDRYPQRASGVVSVWSSGTIPAGTLFELYRSGERYFYRRGSRWIELPGLVERYPVLEGH